MLIGLAARAEPVDLSHPVIEKITPPPRPLGVVSFPNGKAINLSVNIAAGAFHPPDTAGSTIYTVTARGPVIPCRQAKTVIGLDETALCGGDAQADIAPLPSFSPSVYVLDIGADNVARVVDLLPIKDRAGQPLNGIADGEPDDTGGTYDAAGKLVVSEEMGIHPGGIVRLRDGTFWIGERYAPSLLHIAGDGTVLERIVPDGTVEDYARANYLVRGGLPEAFSKLDASADGLSLALSPDERTLILALTGPRPDTAGLEANGPAIVRVLRFDLTTRLAEAQFAYALEPPEAAGPATARLSEIIALDDKRYLTVERLSGGIRIFIVDFGKSAAIPTLIADGPLAGRVGSASLLPKTLLFDSRPFGSEPAFKGLDRIESVALLSDRSLVLISDNAFGIEGERVRMFKMTFAAPVLR